MVLEAEDVKVETFEVLGWPLARLAGQDEPRILDVVLAERLGYWRAADIRKLIGRLASEGILNKVELFATVAKSQGRPATEYWLTEEQAILVTTQSKTEKAIAMLKTVVHVFRLALRGGLSAPPAADAVLGVVRAELDAIRTEFRTELGAISSKLLTLERRPTATVSETERTEFDRLRRACVQMRKASGRNPSLRSANRSVQNLIEDSAEWTGKLAMIPSAQYPEVMRAIERDLGLSMQLLDQSKQGKLALCEPGADGKKLN